MNSFRRSYQVALTILGLFVIPSFIASLVDRNYGLGHGLIFITVFGTALFPVIRKGGVESRPRLALGIASILTLAFGFLTLSTLGEFIDTGGSEGPRGEGSPLAIIIAMAFVATVFFCPWLLATLRGIKAIRHVSPTTRSSAAPN